MAGSDFHFYNKLFTMMGDTLTNYVNNTATNVIGAISPVAKTMLMIYVLLMGFAVMRGMIQEPIVELAVRIIKAAVIVGIALQIGLYNDFLATWLWQTPDALASYVGGGTGATNAQYLDTLMTKMYDFGDAYMLKANANSTMGIPDVSMVAMAYGVWIAGLLMTAVGAFLLALSKIALALALGVGPIFVLLTLFEATKRFFDTWIGLVIQFVFLAMLSSAALNLIAGVLMAYLGDAGSAGVNADPALNQALPALAMSIVTLLLLSQTPGMASSLSSGVALSTLGAGNWAMNKATGGVTGARDLASGKTVGEMRHQRRRRSENAEWARSNPSRARQAAGAPMAIYRKITGADRNRVSRG